MQRRYLGVVFHVYSSVAVVRMSGHTPSAALSFVCKKIDIPMFLSLSSSPLLQNIRRKSTLPHGFAVDFQKVRRAVPARSTEEISQFIDVRRGHRGSVVREELFLLADARSDMQGAAQLAVDAELDIRVEPVSNHACLATVELEFSYVVQVRFPRTS